MRRLSSVASRCHNPRTEVHVTYARSRNVRDLFEAALENRPDDPLLWLRDTCEGATNFTPRSKTSCWPMAWPSKVLTLAPRELHLLASVAGSPELRRAACRPVRSHP